MIIQPSRKSFIIYKYFDSVNIDLSSSIPFIITWQTRERKLKEKKEKTQFNLIIKNKTKTVYPVKLNKVF